jgi:hypothetical protein
MLAIMPLVAFLVMGMQSVSLEHTQKERDF